MDQNIETTIAIISDLHIGDSARSQDLTPHSPTADSNRYEKNYLSNFQSFVTDSQLKADYLFISGDISSRADAAEFFHASKCLETIAVSLGVPNDHIVFVPGNHDIDWTVLRNRGEDTTGYRWSQRYGPLKHEITLFTNAMSRSDGNLLEAPYIARWEFGELLVIGYNSAWHDAPDEPIHHGKVDQAHIFHLDKLLSEIDDVSNKLRVFLVHHHPIIYSNPIPGELDFSAMQNADNLLKVLRKHKFDLLVHGHKHCPHFRATSEDSGFPLAILGAGSFSAQLGTWFQNISNQFHLIHMEKRSGSTEYVQGFVRSWGFLTGHGWKQSSEEAHGIAHQLPFGTYVPPAVIRSRLISPVRKDIETRGHSRWSRLIRHHSEYQFLPLDTARNVLAEIAKALHCELLDTSSEGSTDFILVKALED